MCSSPSESHESIRRALAALPRESASEEFTAQVLAEASTRRSQPPRATGGLKLAAVLTLVLVGVGFFVRYRLVEERSQRQREALLQQHQELRRELDELRRQAASPPTLYLGTASDFDVVLDLGPWMESPSVQPAAYQPARQ